MYGLFTTLCNCLGANYQLLKKGQKANDREIPRNETKCIAVTQMLPYGVAAEYIDEFD